MRGTPPQTEEEGADQLPTPLPPMQLDPRAALRDAVVRPNRDDCLAAIRAALAAGADVNAGDSDEDDERCLTPLHLCSKLNPDAEAVTAAVKALVAAGAEVRAMDRFGQEPLHYAASNQDAKAAAAAVAVLVAAGADVRAKEDFGQEPVHYAASNQDAKAAAAAVTALVAAGEDVRAKGSYGRNPLHHAAAYQNVGAAAVVQALVAAGADGRAKDRNRQTPLQLLFRRPFTPELAAAAAELLSAEQTDAGLEAIRFTADPRYSRQLLPGFIASHLPLTDAQWALLPTSLARYLIYRGLSRALPAALACSDEQARQVVRRLLPDAAQRLRTFALCVARVQRLAIGPQLHRPFWPLELPPGIVRRILSFFDA